MNSSPSDSECIEWHLPYRDRLGYGRKTANGVTTSAHRYVYIQAFGEIPKGLELDHLCSNRACVNLDHLEPVTHAENVRRGRGGEWNRIKTHCKHGHPFDDDNTYTNPTSGLRSCKACHKRWDREFKDRKRRARGLA